MIGMMYLVLTAMLALNVSKEIINAFVTQDNQMLVNNNNMVEGINGFLTKFSMRANDPNTKKSYKKWEPKVKKVINLSNTLDDFLLTNLNQLMEEAEQEKEWFTKSQVNQITSWKPIEKIKNKEDYDIATRLFGGEKNSTGFERGGEIRNKLLVLRDSLLLTMGNYVERSKVYELRKEWLDNSKILEAELSKVQHPDKLKLLSIYNALYQPETLINHEKQQIWQLVKFDHQPVVGAIGVFTELRNQVRMAQQKSLELVSSKMDGQLMQINKIEPQLIASSRYLNYGDTMGVRVDIVAYDSNATYPIKYQIGNQQLESNSNRFTLKANSVGTQQVSGSLVLDLADGKKEFPWNFEYTVGKPMGSISSPEYNVLFSDNYENIIEASFSGYSSSDISVSCPTCLSVNKRGDKYMIKVKNGTKPEIKLRAKGSVLVRKYEVRPVPKPEFKFLGKSYGRVAKPSIPQGEKCFLKLPVSSILNSIKYEVTSFRMEVATNRGILDLGRSNSSRLTSEMKSALRKLGRGERFTFTDIKYKVVGSSRTKSFTGNPSFKAG